MRKEVETNPWYKKWWGVLICIVFLPITLTYLLWKKTEWKLYLKILATAAILIVTFSAMASNSTSNTPSSNEPVFTPSKETPKGEVKEDPVKETEVAPTPTPTPTPAPTPVPVTSTKDQDTSCDPNYTPCVPNVSYDLDCGDIGFPVTVTGTDKHRFDRDGDGYGCESN